MLGHRRVWKSWLGASSNPRLFEVEGFASIQAKIWGGDCPPAPDSQVTTALFFFLRDDHDHDAGVLSNIWGH